MPITLTNPLAHFQQPCCTVLGMPIYAATGMMFSEVYVLKSLDPKLLKGLKLIFAPFSPIPHNNGDSNGWYHTFFQVIWVRVGKDRKPEHIQRTLLHETGHHIWSLLDDRSRSRFASQTKRWQERRKKQVNDWNNPEERFADSVALTYLSPSSTGRQEVMLIQACENAIASLI